MKVFCIILAAVIALGLFVDICVPQYGFFAKVNAGHVGIVDYFGHVEDKALQPGFHFTNFFQKVVPIDARIQKTTVQLEAFSKDIQQVILDTTVNFSISADKAGTLYKTIGMNYVSTLIMPRLQENTKAVIGGYTAETLVANREDISTNILSKMKNDMEQYGINVTVVSIENIDFTDAFESAVEAKQVATQDKQRAQTQQEQQTMETEQAAKRKKIDAEADAEVAKVKADSEAYQTRVKAEAQAEANSKISDSLSQELIDYTQALNWNGQLPSTYMGSDDAIPIISTGSASTFEDIFGTGTTE